MKKGLIRIIILVVVGVLVIGGAGAAYYFYNFHVFETFRVCIGEAHDTKIPCVEEKGCLDFLEGMNKSSRVEEAIETMPEFLKSKLEIVVGEVLYCNSTCYVRETRGVDTTTGEIIMLESCREDEEEVIVEIRGKEGLEILKWLKKQKKNS